VLTLGQDGKVQGSYTVVLQGGMTASVPVSGSWSVVQDTDAKVNLTLNLIVHGNNGQTQPVNSSATVEIVDHDTLRDTATGTITKRIAQ
jgi:hypothetical protein